MAKSLFLVLTALAAAGNASARSCDAYCSSTFGSQSRGYVIGTAPICSGDCVDCHDGDACGELHGDYSDGGEPCWTGSKQCCCTNPQVEEAKEEVKEEPLQVSSPVDGQELEVALAGEGHAFNKSAADSLSLQVSRPSCNEYCRRHGIKYGYVRGTAPFCGGGPGDCCENDYPGMQDDHFSDGGDVCWSGSKQCCCGTRAGQSGCPRPGPNELSCWVVTKVCDVIAGQAKRTSAACNLLATEGAALCFTVGLASGPWAIACATVVSTSIKIGCDNAIRRFGQYAAHECKVAANCAVSGGMLEGNISAMLSNTTGAVVI